MNADIERGILTGQFQRMLERLTVGHQRSRCENAVAVRLDNTLIYVGSETEIIRIDDEALQNSLSWICKNFFGFARKSFIKLFISLLAPLRLS